MIVPLPGEPPEDDPTVRFPSLAALREAHTCLLESQGENGAGPEIRQKIESFLRRGRATGALLNAGPDRRVAQSLLDYWATLLYRLDRSVVAADLDAFDPELAPELKVCPYVGLDAFHEKDHAWFFGRRGLVDQMVGKLSDLRLLAILGPSGSGKSSLVLGGLLPRLKAGARSGSEAWHYLPRLVPGSAPFRNLAAAILPPGTSPERIGELAARLLRDPGHLTELAAGDRPWIVVIDQFEELFTLSRNEAANQAFAESLRLLVSAPAPRHVVLLTLRSDYEMQVARLAALHPLVKQGEVRVPPLSAAELREAIEKPAEIVGLRFEEGLVDRLVFDILGDPAGLPLLQFTLLKLWESRDHNWISLSAYRELGSGRDALAKSARKFFENRLSPAEQVTARRILLRMVRPGASFEVTSSRVRRKDLLRLEDPSRVQRVLDKLIEAHLLRLTEGETADDVQVEVAHEALIRHWLELVKWLDEERAQMVLRDRWEAQAEEWARLGRGDSGLMDEVQLSEVERWLGSTDADRLGHSAALTELVRASRAAIEKRKAEEETARQRKVSRLWWSVAALATLLAVTVAVFVFALVKQREVQSQKEELYQQTILLQQQRSAAKQHRLAEEQEKQRIEALQRENKIRTLEDALAALSAEEERVGRLEGDLDAQKALVAQSRKDLQKALAEAKQQSDRALAAEKRQSAQAEQTIADLKARISALEARPPTPAPSRRTRLQVGTSVGVEGGPRGGLCCIVRGRDGQRYLLSLASLFRGEPGTPVLQFSEEAAAPVAVLQQAGRLGALARPLPQVSLDFQIPRVGPIRGIETTIHQRDQIRLIRPGSGVVRGRVLQVRKNGDSIREVVLDLPGAPGDLGAPVLAESGDLDLIGMIYRSEGSKSYVIPIGLVLRELNVELIDEGGNPLR